MSARERTLSMQEIKTHKSQNSTWIVIDNNVYDVTHFLLEHPGGADSILEFAGDDATQAFEDVGHSSDARELMKSMKIGQLDPNKPPCKGTPSSSPCEGRVHSIVVPREARERSRRPIPIPSYWPWALAVLAGTLVVGFVFKRYYA